MERAAIARLNRLVGKEPEILGPPQRGLGHEAQRLARVHAFDHRNLVGTRLDSISDPVQDLASICARHGGPCPKGCLRGAGCGIDIGRITTRHMRNEWYRPFARRLDIEYPSGVRHVIINCFTPIDDGHIQLCQWLYRNDTEADCPAQMLIDFDEEITREDKDILESTDPDAVVDLRRRGVEYSMDSDRPGVLIRRQLMALLAAAGEDEVHR